MDAVVAAAVACGAAVVGVACEDSCCVDFGSSYIAVVAAYSSASNCGGILPLNGWEHL